MSFLSTMNSLEGVAEIQKLSLDREGHFRRLSSQHKRQIYTLINVLDVIFFFSHKLFFWLSKYKKISFRFRTMRIPLLKSMKYVTFSSVTNLQSILISSILKLGMKILYTILR